MSTPKRENPGECECCGFPTYSLTLYADMDTHIGVGGKTIKADFWFCDLCASTQASKEYRYLLLPHNPRSVLQAISFVGNTILAAIAAQEIK